MISEWEKKEGSDRHLTSCFAVHIFRKDVNSRVASDGEGYGVGRLSLFPVVDNFPQVCVEVGWNIMVKGESLDVL